MSSRRRISAHLASVAIHTIVGVTIVSLAPLAPKLVRAGGSERGPIVVFVPSTKVLAQPDARGDRPAADSLTDTLGIHVDADASIVSVDGFRFDYTKIVKRAGSLFPFVTGSIALEVLAEAVRTSTSTRLTNPFGRAGHNADSPPRLMLAPDALQGIVDKAWSRRDRWRAFQTVVPFINAYDPNDGAMPVLLRRYVEQDGLQPYVDAFVRDLRLWTQLTLAADHADFIDLISRYAAAHPSTKATTELLFLLDDLVQASFDTLQTLLDVVPDADLEWTRRANPNALDAIVIIQQHFREELARRSLTSRNAVRQYYDEARLGILSNILATSPRGYRTSDAMFLTGGIYWKQGRAAEAVASWREMHPDSADRYAVPAGEVLKLIHDRDARDLDVRSINLALRRQQANWVSDSYERLRQFGYHFNTY